MRTRVHGLRAVAAATAAALLLGAAIAAPASAITRGGTLDGDDHPQVGLLTVHAEGGEYLWRCTGTLISERVFITAGHCTEPDDSQGFGLPAYGLIFWSSELIEPDPEFDITNRSCDGVEGYPCGDPGEGVVVRTGELFVHPDYDPNAFYTHDLGVVILDEPYNPPGDFAELPELNSLDELERGQRFDSVGFGLQRAHGPGAAWRDIADRIRMVAHPYLIQINIGRGVVGDFAMVLSNNPTTGGTCFGDSGGPNFLAGTLILAAVTSFGTNWACGGTGGVYRLDRADDLDWLEEEFGHLF
jgi:Trypsin